MFNFLHHDKYSLKRWRTDQVFALGFGFATALTIIAGSTFVSVASGSKALSLLESIFPTTRFLASSVMTASATILALMVTLLSFAAHGKRELSDITLERVRQIALFGTISFVMAVIFLSLHSLPLSDISIADSRALRLIFYGTLAYTGVLGGLLVGVMFLLYFAVRDMIRSVNPGIDR